MRITIISGAARARRADYSMESKRTGKSVKFSDKTTRAAKGEEKKKGKRKKVELGEDTGKLEYNEPPRVVPSEMLGPRHFCFHQ